jgi:hypothetical protein
MSGPFRKTASIVDKQFLPGSERNEILSIELSLDGFSFAILDPRHFRYLMLESYQYEPGIPAADFPGHLERFISDYPLLLGSFERISVAWFQPQFTLVPADLFLHSGRDSYHHFTGDIPQGYELKTDKLNNLGAYGLYPFPEMIRKRIEFLYPSHRVRHTATVLIENLLSALRLGEDKTDLVLYIHKGHFEFLLFEGDRLVFYNSFAYKAFDDLLYFLFFVLEQFQLDPHKLEALLAGEISLDAKEYDYLAQYFKKTGFVGRSDVYKYGPEFDDIPHHTFFNLLHLNTCG